MWHWMKQHPVMSGLMVLLSVAGAVAGVLLLPDEWSLARRIGGGLLSGVGIGLILLSNRMLGAYIEPEVDVRRDVEPPE